MKKIISAQEQFESKMYEFKPTYADEVCGVNYHYCEVGDWGYFFGDMGEYNRFFFYQFATFNVMRENYYPELVSKWLEVDMNTPAEMLHLTTMKVEQLMTDHKLLATYCDFLFCNADYAIEVTEFADIETDVPDDITNEDDNSLTNEDSNDVSKNDIIGAECSDVNAISGMLAYLKQELIRKIEAQFSVLDVKRFNIRIDDRDYFNDINCVDNDMWLEIIVPDNELQICFNYAHDDAEVDSYSLTNLYVDELMHIYAQMHK